MQVHRNTVHKWIADGRLPAVRRGGWALFIARADAEAFERAYTVPVVPRVRDKRRAS